MNSERDASQTGVRLELKVCERCGALWCRELGSKVRVCGRCECALSVRPTDSGLKRGRRRAAFAGTNVISEGVQ
jgi:hypothetical protein